ncbi:carbohydrate kinase family protein [Parasedimentitalea psychrophila]|uniref:PfkB family carbohydrate kinase n=1 Tax=Parasedimentitalea psychrophila TaxID=2997337 RepID=A0A9Y2L0N4_9RHOB|nr:PfkB family carbohydrate kinase [Parasedimentitalea psychrophila]WIY25810.1 PfkB family carbohydrate kinase [Parasedimentitalea psychrophila]
MPTLGTEVFADDLTLSAGGGAFITAATLQALGKPASLLATLPAAPFDEVVKTDIQNCSVNASRCRPASEGGSPQVTVAIANSKDRAFISHQSGRAIPDIVKDSLKGIRHLHIGELRSLVEHPKLIEQARSAGLTISLDCGWDDEVMAGEIDVGEIISAVDIFFPNRIEFERLTALGLPADATPLTVVKCGADGARALGTDGWKSATCDPTDVIDATGAGDSFNGGFLSVWLENGSLDRCLKRGNQCGHLAVQSKGGIGAYKHWCELT